MLWLVTIIPARALEGNVMVVLPTVVHVWPSTEMSPVIVVPARVSRSHTGGVCEAPASQEVCAPSLLRVMNSMLPLGSTSSMTCAADGLTDSRIITPAFAFELVFCRLRTRARISPSPLSGWLTNWKASAAPQMSAPAPLTVNCPLLNVADPGCPTAPTSWLSHGLGKVEAAAVVNDHTGPVVVPLPLCAAICQKYVVALVSDDGA